MTEQDELRDRAARIAYEIEVQNYGGYDWETAKAYAGKQAGEFEFAPPLYQLDMAYEIADDIIALVRADERKRIREQLLGDKAVDKAAWLLRFDDDGLSDSSHLEIISSRNKAKSLLDYSLWAIGLDVEEDV